MNGPERSFSVVIPTYQRREVVCRAVRALAQQDYGGEIELIVVVDGSTDGTAEAVSALECPFPVRVIEQRNRGAAAARNRGAEKASGDIILFLDDDMICDRDVIAQHNAMYGAGTNAVIGDFPLHPDSPPGFISDAIRKTAAWRRDVPAGPFDVFTGQLSVERPVFEELGGFDESFAGNDWYGNEDMDFGVRLLGRYRVRHNPQAVSHQLNLVGPREYMRRARRAAAADVRFAAKHPELRQELLRIRGEHYRSTRLLYRPLSRVPLIAGIFAELATRVAEIGLETRFRSHPGLARLFNAAYTVNYWSAFRASREDISSGGDRRG